METSDLDEEHSIKNLYNNKALHYCVKFNGKNVNKVPVFKHWLNLMKLEKGEKGIIFYCTECHLVFYFQNYRQKHLYIDDCSCHDVAEFCDYCGELYSNNSICCIRIARKLLKRDLYNYIQFDWMDYILYEPLVSLIYYISNIFFLLFRLRKKGEDINYKNDIIMGNKITFIILMLIVLLYSLIFFVYYLNIYLFHLFFFIQIREQKRKDKNENFIRY